MEVKIKVGEVYFVVDGTQLEKYPHLKALLQLQNKEKQEKETQELSSDVEKEEKKGTLHSSEQTSPRKSRK